MAGRFRGDLLAYSLPTFIAILALYWIRKKKKNIYQSNSEIFETQKTNSEHWNHCNFDSGLNSVPQVESEIEKMHLIDSNSLNVSMNVKISNSTSNPKDEQDLNEIENLSKKLETRLDLKKSEKDVQKKEISKPNQEPITNGNLPITFLQNDSIYSNALKHIEKTDNDSTNCDDDDDEREADERNNKTNLKHLNVKKSFVVNMKGVSNESKSTILTESKTKFKAHNYAKVVANGLESKEISKEIPKEISKEISKENSKENSKLIDSNSELSGSNYSFTNANKKNNNALKNNIDHSTHPSYSDNNSEGSSEDSGKGSVDIQGGVLPTFNNNVNINNNNVSVIDPVIIYQFEIPQDLCGLLIGTNGHYVNLIKERSNTKSVVVNRHPYSSLLKICSLEGTRSQVKRALGWIRNRFPIHNFPHLTLQQINVLSPIACQIPAPQTCQLHLPEGVSCDVALTSIVNAGHIFLQQPTHPTFPSLSRLFQFMTATYTSIETPLIINPYPGAICAVTLWNGWFRGMVVNVLNDDECDVKFVDYGGYSKIPVMSLRQIRCDFMTLPFQASECYLANVKPIDENNGWSNEANLYFEQLAQGSMLQANIVSYANDGVPLIHVHKVQGASTIFINRELVDHGFAQWVDMPIVDVN